MITFQSMTEEMLKSRLEDLAAMVMNHTKILDPYERKRSAAECRYLLNQLLRETP